MAFEKNKIRYLNGLYVFEISILNLKKNERSFFHLRCYDTSMCGGK